jgi:hypothetical protein
MFVSLFAFISSLYVGPERKPLFDDPARSAKAEDNEDTRASLNIDALLRPMRERLSESSGL